MSINATCQSIKQMIPTRDQMVEKCSNLASNVARNLNKVAIPVIALLALSSIPGADAGPVSYTACVQACTVVSTPIGLPACMIGCLPFSGPWCP